MKRKDFKDLNSQIKGLLEVEEIKSLKPETIAKIAELSETVKDCEGSYNDLKDDYIKAIKDSAVKVTEDEDEDPQEKSFEDFLNENAIKDK
jgi:uncharacterized protein (DUF342 family)